MERFEGLRFSVPAGPPRREVLRVSAQFNREDGSGSRFGSWKTVPAVPVPRSVPGKTPYHLMPVTIKTGRADFRNQRFEPDTGKMRKMRKALVILQKQPCPSFPVFFGKRHGQPPKKQGFFSPTGPLKSLEKKGKTLKKTRNSSQGKKKQGMPKKQGKEGQGRV